MKRAGIAVAWVIAVLVAITHPIMALALLGVGVVGVYLTWRYK